MEVKLKWTKYCVFSAAGADNTDANPNNILFAIKDTNLHVPVVPLTARYNRKLSKRCSKGFERSVYWNEFKTKSENKNMKNEYRFFLESNFLGVNRLFVLAYTNHMSILKDLKLQDIIYQKA